MPYFEVDEIIDPDSSDLPMTGLAVDNYPSTHGRHKHVKGQLMYCSQGVSHFYGQDRYFLLPPSKAVWIPGGIEHEIKAEKFVSYRSLYIDEKQFLPLPAEITIIQVEPVLKLLIEKFCLIDVSYTKDSQEYRLATVIVDFINKAKPLSLSVCCPSDKRLKVIFDSLIHSPETMMSVDEYASLAHLSARSLNRLSQKEFGMSFEKWRLQIKLMYALELLESCKSVTEVSQRLGYSNDSSFIARFKQWYGETPAQYRKTSPNNESPLWKH